MKKLLVITFTLILSFTLIGCKENSNPSSSIVSISSEQISVLTSENTSYSESTQNTTNEASTSLETSLEESSSLNEESSSKEDVISSECISSNDEPSSNQEDEVDGDKLGSDFEW